MMADTKARESKEFLISMVDAKEKKLLKAAEEKTYEVRQDLTGEIKENKQNLLDVIVEQKALINRISDRCTSAEGKLEHLRSISTVNSKDRKQSVLDALTDLISEKIDMSICAEIREQYMPRGVAEASIGKVDKKVM